MYDSVFDLYDIDTSLETKGVLVQYADVRFLIARSGGSNVAFRRVSAELVKPHRQELEKGLMAEDEQVRLFAKIYAKTVILRVDTKKRNESGEVVTDDTGEPVWLEGKVPVKGQKQPVEYNEKNVVQLLCSVPEMFADLQRMAADVTNFRKAEDEADEGNSEAS